MITPPRIASPKPSSAVRPSRSRSKKGETRATQSGPVLTRTTELATVVYSSEEIQVAKWTARKRPATDPRINSRGVKAFTSAR